jgi:hypothetical protein
MKTQATTTAAATHDVQATGEVLSRPQAPGQSKPSFRLFFFTSLSVLACALALANVAAAATSAGQDQYIEQTPNGGGVVSNPNKTLTEAELKKAAEKNKKDIKSGDNGDDKGASGAVGAAGTTPTPPAAQSVVASAKIGPLSRNTALILGALVLLAGLGVVAFGGGAGAVFGGAGAGTAAGAANNNSTQ